jgi:hypothetical protein
MTTVLVRDGHEGSSAGGGTSESAPLWAGIAALANQAGRRYAPAARSTSQNTNPSRCTVSPTWQAIGALKIGPAWTNV